ncbi:MAG TPA: protein kinase, partial [Thermoanaerobaculia bacterium]
MTLAAGTRLGPYEIVSSLGAGGMGEVYRARDSRLERIVAIKVLPQHLSDSMEVRQRFEREAKTISQLSHPHICALYDVGSQDGVEYLVMEYLEGETLSERLVKGPLPLEQALRAGVEIADALDRAHRQGIVHRDLKPGNVMLTKSGVKLLDFGLAKLVSPPSGPISGLSMMPTTPRGSNLTAEGTILGTFQYMAPEQLEGKEADTRTDIFAFGAVLYEMVAGKKAFSGGSQASLISSIMSSDPPSIGTLQPMSPPALDRVIRTCLAKDPEDRWQSAHDVGRELKWIAEGSAAVAPAFAVSRRRSRERVAWLLAAVAAAAVLVLLWRGRAATPQGLPASFSVVPPARSINQIQLSPDGSRLAFIGEDSEGRTWIWVRPLDSLDARRLEGTRASNGLIWSPDNRSIAFFQAGRLRKVDADGGAIQTICESGSGFGGSWSKKGQIVFGSDFGAGLMVVPASGGAPSPATALDHARGDASHAYPAFLPDGTHFVFVARNVDPEKTVIALGDLSSRETRPLFRSDSAAVWAPPRYLMFAREGALFAQAFDPKSLRTVGESRTLARNIRYSTDANGIALSASENMLVYSLWQHEHRLAWVDRKGREQGTVGQVADYEAVEFSPDGRRVAASIRDPSRGQNLDVWVLDVARGNATRVTTERSDEFDPVWT